MLDQPWPPSAATNPATELDPLLDHDGAAVYDAVERGDVNVDTHNVRSFSMSDDHKETQNDWGVISQDWSSFFVVCFVVLLGCGNQTLLHHAQHCYSTDQCPAFQGHLSGHQLSYPVAIRGIPRWRSHYAGIHSGLLLTGKGYRIPCDRPLKRHLRLSKDVSAVQ